MKHAWTPDWNKAAAIETFNKSKVRRYRRPKGHTVYELMGVEQIEHIGWGIRVNGMPQNSSYIISHNAIIEEGWVPVEAMYAKRQIRWTLTGRDQFKAEVFDGPTLAPGEKVVVAPAEALEVLENAAYEVLARFPLKHPGNRRHPKQVAALERLAKTLSHNPQEEVCPSEKSDQQT